MSVSIKERMSLIKGKTILIIGGTGSLGYELVQWLQKNNKICIFSRDELKQYKMRITYPTLSFLIGDIRDRESIDKALAIFNPHIIIIASALKQIDTCEISVWEAVKTNLIGVKNVVDSVFASKALNIDKVLLISTDKACLSISAYGSTKYLAEKIMIEAGFRAIKSSTLVDFIIVRYGNVLNSRGSLLPKYDQILRDPNQKMFPVTDVRMNRFFMLLSQASSLVEVALREGKSGEIWIPIVDSFKILDIAKYYAGKCGKEIQIIGLRTCEKLDECLVSDHEIEKTQRRKIDDDMYYVINPFYTCQTYTDVVEPYTSAKISSIENFKRLIDLN